MKKNKIIEGQAIESQGEVDENTLGAVGGSSKIDNNGNKTAQPERQGKTKEDNDTSDDDFDDSNLGAVGGVPKEKSLKKSEVKHEGQTSKQESRIKDSQNEQTGSESTKPTDQRSVRKTKFKNLWNLWEIRSSEGYTDESRLEVEESYKEFVAAEQSSEPQETEIEHRQSEDQSVVTEEDKNENKVDDSSIGGAVTTEKTDEDNPEETQPDIIVPFHTSQMNIPLLRPNLLITSDISSTSLLLTTQVESSTQEISTQTQTDDSTQGAVSASVSETSETRDNQEDPDAALRLPRPLTDRKEKYPKDQTSEDPIVISPAALGGTSYRITSNIPQMPVGSPRNYQVLER